MFMLSKQTRNRRFAFEKLERRNLLAGDVFGSELVVERIEFDNPFAAGEQREEIFVVVRENVEFKQDDELAFEHVDAKPELIVRALVNDRTDIDDAVDIDQPDAADDKVVANQVSATTAVMKNAPEGESDPANDSGAPISTVLLATSMPVPAPVATDASRPSMISGTSTQTTPVTQTAPATQTTPATDADTEEVILPRADAATTSPADDDAPRSETILTLT